MRNDEEFEDLAESDTKSTRSVFSGNLRNSRELSENFDGLFYFPKNIFIWPVKLIQFSKFQLEKLRSGRHVLRGELAVGADARAPRVHHGEAQDRRERASEPSANF